MTLALFRVRYVLSAPSHPGNVGSAARAVKTMGFEDLWLINPKTPDLQKRDEAIALAADATDTLERIQTSDSLAHALAPITMSFALTARPRDLGPPSCDIRQAASMAREHLLSQPDARVAVVLGCERSGLSNAEVAQCHYICHIPANPLYSSLNLAQALQLAAWEMRYALIDPAERIPNTPTLQDDPGRQPAPQAAVADLLKHWEQALIAVQFLDPDHPKKLIARMQYLFNRPHMTQDEVNMMRGVCTAMISSSRLR